jgi:hypothetical protein
LTKTTYLNEYGLVNAGYVAIGAQLLGAPGTPDPMVTEPVIAVPATTRLVTPLPTVTDLADAGRDERVSPPGRDATLLAVVPIPGTGTSLAIVGYVISTAEPARAPAPDEPDPESPPAGPGHDAEPGSAGLFLDHAHHRVWADGEPIELTLREFGLLAFLSAHPATVFTRAHLLERVWRRAWEDVPARSRTVDVHVSRLRRKLGPVYGRCLVTEHRAGYQFRLPAQSRPPGQLRPPA